LARSYVKIYGPPLVKAIRALEKVAVDFSGTTTPVREFNILTPTAPYIGDERDVRYYQQAVLPEIDMPVSEKVKMISKSTDTLGDYDFFFEWGKEPTKQEVLDLIAKIDEALADCGCRYTIVTK
jgi:hypothetical protein